MFPAGQWPTTPRERLEPGSAILHPVSLQRPASQFSGKDGLQRSTPQPHAQELNAGDVGGFPFAESRSPGLENFQHPIGSDFGGLRLSRTPMAADGDLFGAVDVEDEFTHRGL